MVQNPRAVMSSNMDNDALLIGILAATWVAACIVIGWWVLGVAL